MVFAYGSSTKNKKRIQNIDHISKNDLGNACIQHDMAFGKYKDLAKRIE